MARLRDMLLQRIREAEVLKTLVPNWPQALITDYALKADDIDLIASAVDNLRPLSGSGDPNSLAIKSNESKVYFNTATNPPEQWYNNTPGSTSNWVRL